MVRNAEYLWPMRMCGAMLAIGAWTASCGGQEPVGSAARDAAADARSADAALADGIAETVAEPSDVTIRDGTEAASMGGHDASDDAAAIDAAPAETSTALTDASGPPCVSGAVDGTPCTGPGEAMLKSADICRAGHCVMPPGFPGCQTDVDCVPGGCLHGFPPGNPAGSICMGTAGIAGAVACGDEVLSCSTDVGCSITDTTARVCGRAAPLRLFGTFSTCDGPSDCPAGQDCCVTTTGMGYGNLSCFARTNGGASSGCPSAPASISRICDPRDPIGTCPQGLTCKAFFFGTGAFTCSP
jgi:hypothetical protein